LETLSISWSILFNGPGLEWSTYALTPNREPFDWVPQVRRLQILLHSDFADDVLDTCDETVYEVVNLMEHLPLIYVTDLALFFESFFDSDTSNIDEFNRGLRRACIAMRFKRLESFHLAFNYDVYGMPVLDLWV
jgi:hypothetical protein